MKKYFAAMLLAVLLVAPVAVFAQFNINVEPINVNLSPAVSKYQCDVQAKLQYKDTATNLLQVKIHYTSNINAQDLKYVISANNATSGALFRGVEGKSDIRVGEGFVDLTGSETVQFFVDTKEIRKVRVEASLGGQACQAYESLVILLNDFNGVNAPSIVNSPVLSADSIVGIGDAPAAEPGVDEGFAEVPAENQPADDGALRQLPAGAAAQFDGVGNGGAEPELIAEPAPADAAQVGECEVIAEAAKGDTAFTMVAAVVYEGLNAGQTPFRVSAFVGDEEVDSIAGVVDVQGPAIGYLLNQDGNGFTFAMEREEGAQTFSVSASVGDVFCSNASFADAGVNGDSAVGDAGTVRVLQEGADADTDALAQALGLNAADQIGKTNLLSGDSIELKDIILYGLLGTIAIVLVALLVVKIKSNNV